MELSNRILEPELMEGAEQAKAYAEADFAEPHDMIVRQFGEAFPDRPAEAFALDLGCGPGDMTIRLAIANPGYAVHAVDGSAAMLELARASAAADEALVRRIVFVRGCIPDVPLPRPSYDVIFSNSLLHHLAAPEVLWETIREYGHSGTLVYIADLCRPATDEDARQLVERYSGREPEVLQRDFYNSLRAAFTPDEVAAQLARAHLDHLRVRTPSDRHLVVWGQQP